MLMLMMMLMVVVVDEGEIGIVSYIMYERTTLCVLMHTNNYICYDYISMLILCECHDYFITIELDLKCVARVMNGGMGAYVICRPIIRRVLTLV